MKTRVTRQLALMLMLVSSLGTAARAQSPADLERAKASFRAGAAAYGAGDYSAAIQALESAYAITPLPAIAFSLAQAERRQYFATHEREHLERALGLFRSYLAQVETGGRRADALDALGQLEPLAALQGASAEPPGGRNEPRRTRIMITTEPSHAQVSIDGGEASTAPVIREVPPGAHRVRVEADGFALAETELTAIEGELVLDEVQLRELPGWLELRVPEASLVYVDGRFAKFGGPRMRLSLAHGPHRIAVAAAGRQSVERELMVERNRGLAVEVELAVTRQRQAARALAVVGAATLASGVVLAGVSLRAQRAAEAFLHKADSQNVSAGELANYASDVDQRDKLRAAAITSAAASCALLLSSLLLHQLDRPRVEQLEREPLLGPGKLARHADLTHNGFRIAF